MKNIFMLLVAVVLMNVGNVSGQTETTINGVPYTLFSPGLWVETWPAGTMHCGDPTEVVEVTSTTGKVWMDRNLGASQVATSSTDSDAYGDLYQWGRFADGHQCRTSGIHAGASLGLATTAEPNAGNDWDGKFITTNSYPWDWLSPKDDNLWQGVNGVNNPCPEGYLVPTEAELIAERDSWSPDFNADGAFSSPLKLTVAGRRGLSNGAFDFVGIQGNYRSSTVIGVNSRTLVFNSTDATMENRSRANGASVRCLKD